MSGQSCIQTIRNISSYMNENTFALLPRHKVLCNISLSTSTITAIKYNMYSSVHTLVLAFYDDLYPETKNKFYKNKLVELRRNQLSSLDQNAHTVVSGRSQMTYKEESWSCSLGLVRDSKPRPLLRGFIFYSI